MDKTPTAREQPIYGCSRAAFLFSIIKYCVQSFKLINPVDTADPLDGDVVFTMLVLRYIFELMLFAGLVLCNYRTLNRTQ